MRTIAGLFGLGLLAALPLASPGRAADWPQFRGPLGSGCAPDDARLPADLGRGAHVENGRTLARPAWRDEETCQTLPASLAVRAIRVVVKQPGFRVRPAVGQNTSPCLQAT